MKRRSPKKFYLVLSVILLSGVFIYLFLNTLYHPYIVWLIATSIVTFLLYGYDKFMAIQKMGRVPEVILHFMSLIGGVTGGWVGMIIFRHKKNKTTFFVWLLVATTLHLYILWFLSGRIFDTIQSYV